MVPYLPLKRKAKRVSGIKGAREGQKRGMRGAKEGQERDKKRGQRGIR